MADLDNTRISLLQYISKFTVDIQMYVETGFYQFLGTAKCQPESFKPAPLTYNTAFVSGILSDVLPMNGQGQIDQIGLQYDYDPFFGEIIIEGSDSKSVGCSEKVNSVTDPCGSVWGSDPAAFCANNNVLRDKKLTQQHMKVSKFSGRLRLMIQAIYGSKRADYSIPKTGAGLVNLDNLVLRIADTEDQDFTLNHNTVFGTHGLYSTDNNRYFLLEVSPSEVSYYKLELSDEAIIWADLLNAHPMASDTEFQDKIECYILSTAKIDVASKKTLFTGLTTPGGSLGYGFKFNRKGSQCKAVLHNKVGLTVEAVEVTMDLSETGDAEAEVLTVVATETASKDWGHGDSLVVWIPLTNSTDGLYYRHFVSAGGATSVTNCPMYGWYDESDVYQEVKITIETSTVTNGVLISDIETQYWNLQSFGVGTILPCSNNAPIGTKTSVTKNGTGSLGQYTIDVGGDLVQGQFSGTTNRVFDSLDGADEATPTFSGSVNSNLSSEGNIFFAQLCDGTAWATYLNNRSGGVWEFQGPHIVSQTFEDPPGVFYREATSSSEVTPQHTETTSISGTNSGKSMLLVPHDDCQAVVYGERSLVVSTSSNVRIYRKSGEDYQAKGDVYKVITSAVPNEYTLLDRIPIKRRIETNLNSPVLSNTPGPGETRYSSQIRFSYSGKEDLHSVSPEFILLDEQEETTTDVASWDEAIFFAPAGTKMEDGTWLCRSSYKGANHFVFYDYNNSATSSIDNGYSPSLHSAVGWS